MELTRRNFLKSAGIIGAGAAIAGISGCANDPKTTDSTPATQQSGTGTLANGMVDWKGEHRPSQTATARKPLRRM